MPKGKGNSLSLLPFRKRKPLGTYHHRWDGRSYYLADKGDHLLKYYPALDCYERIPVKPVTLSDLGLTRTSQGQIIKKEVKKMIYVGPIQEEDFALERATREFIEAIYTRLWWCNKKLRDIAFSPADIFHAANTEIVLVQRWGTDGLRRIR